MMGNLTTAELAQILAANPDVHLDNPAELIAGPGELERRAVQTESQMQAAVFAETERRAVTDARWGLLFAIPNGQYRRGQRPEPGIQPGVPDIALLVASQGYIGMFMELKVGRNVLSAKQKEWHRALREQGHFVCTIYDDPQTAIDVIDWYLD